MNKKDILMVVVIAAVVGFLSASLGAQVGMSPRGSGGFGLTPNSQIIANACNADEICEMGNLLAADKDFQVYQTDTPAYKNVFAKLEKTHPSYNTNAGVISKIINYYVGDQGRAAYLDVDFDTADGTHNIGLYSLDSDDFGAYSGIRAEDGLISGKQVCAGDTCLHSSQSYTVEVPMDWDSINGVNMPHSVCFLTGQKLYGEFSEDDYIILDSSCRIVSNYNGDGTKVLEAENSIGSPGIKCWATCLGPPNLDYWNW